MPTMADVKRVGRAAARTAAKTSVDHLIAGAGDGMSAASATQKAWELEAILQARYHDPNYEFDGTDIAETDVKKAIAYARGKKLAKAKRKGAIGSAKALTHGGFAVVGAAAGSIVPGAGTALGGAAGYVAGAVVAQSVTVAARMARGANWLHKKRKGTLHVHRKQAAHCLYYCAAGLSSEENRRAADAALRVILGDLYADQKNDADRIYARLKSN